VFDHTGSFASKRGTGGLSNVEKTAFLVSTYDLRMPYVSDHLTHFVGRSKSSDEERLQLLVQIVRSGVLLDPSHVGQRNPVFTVVRRDNQTGEENNLEYLSRPSIRHNLKAKRICLPYERVRDGLGSAKQVGEHIDGGDGAQLGSAENAHDDGLSARAIEGAIAA
jgi:hypothetical protein